MTIHFRVENNTIVFSGRTYERRMDIKSIGGRFNGVDKVWFLPLSDENLEKARVLCGDAPAAEVPPDMSPTTGSESPPIAREPRMGLRIRGFAPTPKADDHESESPESATTSSDYTVSQIANEAWRAINHAFPRAIWVVGEVQNAREHNGHLYCDLADIKEGASKSATITIKVTVWADVLSRLRQQLTPDIVAEVLQDGMKVRARVAVSLFKDRGQLSLALQDLDPVYTRGALALAREALLKELRSAGLDKAQSLLPLPPFPFMVGLVSAPGSRAETDFRHQLLTRGFSGDLLFCPAATQGEATPLEIETAISRLTDDAVDLIVLTRGGGSAADLRWFDDPRIAYAIARCPIPIIAAIGHHDDTCVAEMVCFCREKTPTAAADFVLDIFNATRERLKAAAATLAGTLDRRLESVAGLQAALGERIAATATDNLARRRSDLMQRSFRFLSEATNVITTGQRQLDRKASELDLAVTQSLQRRRDELTRIDRSIAVMDPTPRLKDGWTVLYGPAGKITSIAGLTAGTSIHARLTDGRLDATVTSTSEAPKR